MASDYDCDPWKQSHALYRKLMASRSSYSSLLFSSSSKSYKGNATGHPNFVLTVSDNGVSFPANLDFRNTESLGLQLVEILVDQIGAAIELNRNRGTECKILFKELKKKRG